MRISGQRLARVVMAVCVMVPGLVTAANSNGPERTHMADQPSAGDPANFDTLDAYLAFLEANGPMGVAWFRLREDGLYERIARRPPGQGPELFTRQELLDRFGFSE